MSLIEVQRPVLNLGMEQFKKGRRNSGIHFNTVYLTQDIQNKEIPHLCVSAVQKLPMKCFTFFLRVL